jgi:hypothetical protein
MRVGNFFECLHDFPALGMVAGPGRELGVAQGAQFPAQRLPAHRDAELLPHPLCEIDQPPPDDTMDRGHRAALNDVHHGATVCLVKDGSLARLLAIQQTVRATGVETKHPITNHL